MISCNLLISLERTTPFELGRPQVGQKEICGTHFPVRTRNEVSASNQSGQTTSMRTPWDLFKSALGDENEARQLCLSDSCFVTWVSLSGLQEALLMRSLIGGPRPRKFCAALARIAVKGKLTSALSLRNSAVVFLCEKRNPTRHARQIQHHYFDPHA